MWSNDYRHIPFEDNGRSRTGVDCWGLVRLVYEDHLGIILPSLDFYEDTLDFDKIPPIVDDYRNSEHWTQIIPGQEREFDVLVFKMMGVPMHVGVVIGRGEMLHSQKGCGTHVSNYVNEQEWSRRLVGIYRHAKRTDSYPTLSHGS